MEKQQKDTKVRDMFEDIAPRYDLLNRLLSFGIDKGWRRRLVRDYTRDFKAWEGELSLLDVATGTADLIVEFSRQTKRRALSLNRIEGMDITPGMLEVGRRKLQKKGVAATLSVGDAMSLEYGDGEFSALSCAFGVRNFPDVRRGVQEMHRVLCSGGRAYILEYSPSEVRGLWGALFKFYFKRILPLVGGLISGSRTAYEYLPSSVDGFYSAQQFAVLLGEVGFSQVRVLQLTGGVVTLYECVKMDENI